MSTNAASKPTLASRYGDIGLAALVIAIVAMMILELPPSVLDVLITLNISMAVIIMIVSLYVNDAVNITALPTILLLTTLFRLALNVASTRLILLTAHAGEVIQAFGQFVVRGNFVVGGVVFLILTLIQFIVIAKGGERVAEVGARFTLDAMPGKQMSIDAELRTGALSHDEARSKRRALARESQFYGAMDGAMKFVKGDAIAGIIITAINIVGGLTIGVMQRGMAVGDAAKTYALLTIGDGLVSQIPSLLLGTAAGLIVTRVASEDAGTSLGGEIVKQIFQEPRALLVASAFLAVAGVIPGMPTIPFLLVAAALFALSRRKSATTLETPKTARLFITGIDAKAAQIELQTLCDKLGLPIPELETRQGEGTTNLRLDGLDVAWGNNANQRQLALVRNVSKLLGIQETQSLLDKIERSHPALVRAVVPKPITLPTLADILRRLIDEDVPISALRDILEALATHGPNERDAVMLSELARQGLRPYFTRRYAPTGQLSAYLLDPFLEDSVRDGIQRTPAGAFLALSPSLSRDITDALVQTLPQDAVLMTQSDVRRFVRRLLENIRPDVAVLSFQDVDAGVDIEPLGQIAPLG